MYCSQCGKEIPDNSKFCNECGKEVLHSADSEMQNVESNEFPKTENTDTKKPTKKNIVIITIVTLVVLIAAIFAVTSNSSFSTEEEYGLKIVEKYQDMLKNPDSLILRSDVAVISYSRDGKTYKYAFFDASGENSYGASVTSTPCFVNGQYFCDSDEIPTAEEYMSMDDAEAKEYLGLQLALATWRLYGEDAAEKKEDVIISYSVSAEKIAKKLKIESRVN